MTQLKKEYGISESEKILIHISNFRKVKRVQDVVQAFAKIVTEVDAKLLLVGDGPEFCTILQLVKNLHIEDRVLFLGKQDNVAELLAMSDLMLLLSEKESFGLVLLEAMACGVPCIGTRVEVFQKSFNMVIQDIYVKLAIQQEWQIKPFSY